VLHLSPLIFLLSRAVAQVVEQNRAVVVLAVIVVQLVANHLAVAQETRLH
jgi:hypothetical protein